MSKTPIQDLEALVDQLSDKVAQLATENTTLQDQCDQLQDKNEKAKARIEGIVSRLKILEQD